MFVYQVSEVVILQLKTGRINHFVLFFNFCRLFLIILFLLRLCLKNSMFVNWLNWALVDW